MPAQNTYAKSRLALVILAAGESHRFGSAKQLAAMDGVPMLQLVINHCLKLKALDLYVTLGARAEAIQTEIDFSHARIIHNPEWQNGIGRTISTATEQLCDAYEGILFIAGDQPLITAQEIQPMLDCWQNQPDLICCAEYAGKPGIPAIFPKSCYPALLQLDGDQGAKKILLDAHTRKNRFAMPQAEVDIDRVEDIAKLLKETNKLERST